MQLRKNYYMRKQHLRLPKNLKKENKGRNKENRIFFKVLTEFWQNFTSNEVLLQKG